MAAGLAGPRVLVVDDTEVVRALIRRVLTGSGYQVDVAGSTREARALSPADYDVLLIDAHLSGEPGTVLIEELRAADPDSARRCLLVTAGLTDRAPAGVARLSKPFQPAPPARADIEVQPGAQALEFVLTVTPLAGDTVRSADATAAQAALAQLAAGLGGTVQAGLSAFPWRVRLGLAGS